MPKRFSASVAAQLMACPASANLDKAIVGWVDPVEDRTANNAANRGTNMHEVFASVMALPNADMQQLIRAMQYVADLRKTRRFKVLVEQTVKASWLQSQPDTQVDLVLYTQDEIHVLDLKTGRILVDVVDNAQLLYYAACFAPLAPKAKGVHLHIAQPWADNMEHWYADTNVLGQFMAEAQAAEARILSGDVTFGPSDHCKFCPANPHGRGAKGSPCCPAMMQILYPTHVNEDEILAL
jgi:hypothetical protein